MKHSGLGMRCPVCNSFAVLHDGVRGEYICTRCGLVIMERLLEPGPEWRGKPGKEIGRADVTAGTDITLHDFGLGSKFDITRDLPPSWRANLRRMRLWQRRSRVSSWNERSLREGLLELDKFCEDLALPKDVKAEASHLFRKARAAKLTAGRDTHQVLVSLIFIVCRLRALPRTEKEIARAVAARFGIGERRVIRSMRSSTKFLAEKLGIKIPKISVDNYINRFATQLALSKRTIEHAHKLHESLPQELRRAKSPLLLTAIVLYLASEVAGERITLRKLASTVGVGVSSISKNLTKFRSALARAKGL